MEDLASGSSVHMHGVGRKTRTAAEGFRADFSLGRELPGGLAQLDRISMNFAWSWLPGGVDVFRDLDPRLWDECEQNPRLLLKRVDELTLRQWATDPEYTARVAAFSSDLERYLALNGELRIENGELSEKDDPQHSPDSSLSLDVSLSPDSSLSPDGEEISETKGPDLVNSQFPILDPPLAADPDSRSSIAYFCAEFGVHNSLPNYSGGLGILAGDHLKSASDLGLPLVAVGLLYRYGYFRQNISHEGWQEESYFDLFASELALTPVVDDAGERVAVHIHIRGREVRCQAWLAQVGRIKLYLLDTNVPENSEIDRLITGHLYGGDQETRIVQEKVLGIGGVRLLRKLGIRPEVYHLNEGHSAFLTLELAHEYLEANPSAGFDKARDVARGRCVFTTHTPVEAGNDNFDPETLQACFSGEYLDALKLSRDAFFDLGRINPNNDAEYFGMTPLALRMCRSANGVSRRHGEVSRDLWSRIFDTQGTTGVPIGHVTNGVHPPTWIAPLFQKLFERRLGAKWFETIGDPAGWSAAVASIPDDEIWQVHETLKQLLVAFVRKRLKVGDVGTRDTINEHSDTSGLLSADALTIGFARRVAAYKRWDLIFTDVERLLRMVDDSERPVQFVFAGKAHPQDNKAKQILQNLMSINHNSGWQRRAVFIEDYDQEVARYLVHGVDVWMNVPRRPLEASGTSGMKAAMNGVLNLSILDGWWIEGYDGTNGFAIGGREVGGDPELVDVEDAEALYSTLEREIVPTFYSPDANGLRSAWIAMMKNSMATLTPRFSSDRMVRQYVQDVYRAE